MRNDPAVDPLKAEPKFDTVSALVRHLGRTLPMDEDVSVGRLLRLLGVHGFAFFLLVLALLNVAIFMLPGLSILFGVPMVVLAVQMLLGLGAPVFPAFICNRHIDGFLLHRGISLSVAALEKIETGIKPRLLFVTHPSLMRVHCLLALVLGFMVAIPVPFLNLPPTTGIVLLTLGLLQRDGLFVLGAYLFALWSFHLYESLGRAAGTLF